MSRIMLELGEPSVSLSNIPTDSQGKDTRDCQGRDKIIWRKNIRYYLGPGVVIQPVSALWKQRPKGDCKSKASHAYSLSQISRLKSTKPFVNR